ncbi:DedA family protein [Roseiconus nitratireducens]|uniref:DedA family protein n=1 Tax=Roseiconus nitratireducens TaxID=2605748 RepID=A0A5M6D545_9BACT|nr:DedA family protein [Roseiconus nitratireducens]KAA5542611.1 DedA family protein [Roseiconus nitratireducens]
MTSWIQEFLEQFGAAGVGALMLLENIFPPIPSEVVMPWAGYSVSQGNMSFWAAVGAGSVGSFAGAMFWYLLARWIGQERLKYWVRRHGWWMTLSEGDIRRTEDWFESWGSLAVLVCRLIPGVRTLISVPAGFAEMPTGKFSLYTAIGTIAWTALLAGLGWWLADNYGSLAKPLSYVSTAVVLGLFGWWLYRLVTQRAKRTRAKSGA